MECKLVQPLWKSVWQFLRKLAINLPQAILCLDIYPKDAYSQYKDNCSTMFKVALFAIDGTWKQCRCPSTKEWIKKMWHIYTWSTTQWKRKQWNFEIWRQMDRTRKKYSEWGNQNTERQTQYVLTHKWLLDIKQQITSLLSTTPEKTGN